MISCVHMYVCMHVAACMHGVHIRSRLISQGSLVNEKQVN